MITQRLRGLVNLHAAITTLVAMLLFLAYANMVPWLKMLPGLGFLDLSRELTLMPYILCLVGAMVISTRYLLTFAPKFHRISWVDAARIAARQAALVALFIFTFMFAMKDRGMSRLFLGSYLCLLWGIELLLNKALPHFLSQLLFDQRHKAPTVFIGNASLVLRIENWLANKGVLGIEPVGLLTQDGLSAEGSALPFLGSVADLPHIIEERAVAQVIMLSLPATEVAGRLIIETCQDRGCRLLIYSNLADMLRHPLVIVQEEGYTFYSLQGEPLEDPINRLTKRMYDIVVSLPVVLFVLPILSLWVWAMQRLQAPGRLMFKQRRAGQMGNEFSLLKYRSMYDLERGPELEAKQARKGDDRIFPFGHFIRRTSLDEFPQFLNVLLGQMSIVGPRPHMLAHDVEFSRFYRGYRSRQFAKPGITGLAQVRGFRGEITDPVLLQRRVENDLQYIATWSIWLDVQVTLMTFRQVFFPPRTAY